MRKLFFILVFVFCATFIYAQTPQQLATRIDQLTVKNQVEHAEFKRIIGQIGGNYLSWSDTTTLATRYWVLQNFMQKFYVKYGDYPALTSEWIYKNDTVYVDTTDNVGTGGGGLPDSIYITYGCYDGFADGWLFSEDTIYSDTCSSGGVGDNLGNHQATQPITADNDTITLDDEVVIKHNLLLQKDDMYTPTINLYRA